MTTTVVTNATELLARSKENDAVRDKREKAAPDPLILSDSETVAEVAKKLIAKYHHELATANIIYLFRSKSSKAAGKPVPGQVKKASPTDRHISRSYFQGVGKEDNSGESGDGEADFIITVALDVWNELQPSQRLALVDHLLTRCSGAEDEKTGEMKFSIRPPQVQEFAEVAERHGRWNDDLVELGRCLKE